MKAFLIDKENCSGKRRKRSFEHGSCEGLVMSPNCKRLTVDRDHQSHIPQLKNMKLGSERRVSALELPGMAAPADATCKRREQLVSYGKEAVDRTERKTSRKTVLMPPKAIREAVMVRTGPEDFPWEMHFNSSNRQISSFDPWKGSRPSQTSGRLDCVSSSGCEVSCNGKYNVERVPLVDTRRMDNKGAEVGYKVNEGALQLEEEVYNPKKTSGRLDRVSSSGCEVRNGKYAAKHRTGCEVSRNGKYNAERVPLVDTMHMDNKGMEVGYKVNEGSLQLQKEIYNPKQTSGRLDRVSSSGCEVHNGKYAAKHRTVTEMIQMNNDGKEVGVNVYEGALRVAKSVSRNIVGFGNAESRNIKVTRCDKFKPVAHANEKIMEDREKTDFICSSQSNIEGAKRDMGKMGYSSSGICNISLACKVQNNKSSIPCNYKETCQNKMREVLNLNSIPDEYQADLCRDKVRKVLDLYKDTLERLRQEDKMKPYGKGKIGMQIYVDAAMQLKDHKKWINVNKCVGAVPGIEIGDQFLLRAELVIVGLHSKFVAGIDYKNIDGKLCATSIITSGRYGDKNHSSDVLIYVGEGGKPNSSSEKPEDQKLVRGNLALKNSINVVPVRVIRGIQNMKVPKSMHADSVNKSKFFYDGLYFVRKCWPEREHSGNLVYKFQLERIQGQQDLTMWNTQTTSRKFNKASHGPVVHDISKGKENMPVRVVNAIDCEKPPPFKYTTKMMYHSQQCVVSKSGGCDCLNGCSDEIPCSCVVKNYCKVSVNNSVSIVEKEPIVYECGPCCKCPSDCKNRMSQHGIKLQLELFKTIPTGWGVRSRNFISEGRFICEYVGELLQYKPEEGRIDFDESAFDAGYSSDAKNVKFGNVGRFIRHSCSPNLYANRVLFDHEDKGKPHVMLFAAKNIPPRKELTFDYKLW